MLSPALICAIESELQSSLGTPVSVKSFKPIGGGCINNGAELLTSTGTYFLKYNSASEFPGMLAKEAEGLEALANAKAIRIPKVVANGSTEKDQFLILEFIQTGPGSKTFWKTFGEQLAMLHRLSNEKHGFDSDNYVGSLPQKNDWSDSWISFFIERRLEYQLQLADRSGKLPSGMRSAFEKLYVKLPDLLHNEKPSLLHGDLWSGNYLAAREGDPVIIDPAVYYGCRETDLAMTKLFGGFPPEFYDAYYSALPVLPGAEERIKIYQLYPLLVHVNLFGGGYASQVMSILTKFA